MRKQIASAALLGGLGLVLALGCSAQADTPTQAAEGSAPSSTSKSGPPSTTAEPGMPAGGQAQIANLTGQLEDAFAKQFEQNEVDQAKLARMIQDVIQSFPQPAQARVKIHIDEVFETGQKVASQMPQEERSKAVAPTPKEKLGTTQQGLLAGWGWGGGYGRGFGGFGAFGFPSMYWGWGGYPSTFSYSYPAAGYYGTGWGCGYGGAWCGTGLGLGGWYW